MIKKLINGALLLGLIAGIGLTIWGLNDWRSPDLPDVVALPTPVPEDLRVILDNQPEVVASTSTSAPPPSSTVAPATTSTLPPAPQGDEVEKVECTLPVGINIYLSSADMLLTAPIDVSDNRFDPAKNRVDIHVSKNTNGLPCADTSLPVKLLGHKQHQFCNLVVEPSGFDPCEYGVSLGDQVLIVLEDNSVVEYVVVEPLESAIATPLAVVYQDYYEEREIVPSPAVMFRKYDEYQQFYDEVFPRDDASDELWLFTSCGNDRSDANHPGHSTDSCAVRTEFVRYISVEQQQELWAD